MLRIAFVTWPWAWQMEFVGIAVFFSRYVIFSFDQFHFDFDSIVVRKIWRSGGSGDNDKYKLAELICSKST